MGRRLEELFHGRRRTALTRLKLVADTRVRRLHNTAKLVQATHRLLLKKNDLLNAFFRVRMARGTRGSCTTDPGVSNHLKLAVLNMDHTLRRLLKPLMKSYFALIVQEYMQDKLKETLSRSKIVLRKSRKFTGMSDDGGSEQVPNSDRVNIGQLLMQSANVDIRSLPDDEFCPFTPLFTTRNGGPLDHHTVSKTHEAPLLVPRVSGDRDELSPIRRAAGLRMNELHKSSLPNLYDPKFRGIEHLSRIDGDSNEADSRGSGRSLLVPPISDVRGRPLLEHTDLSLQALLERPTALTQVSDRSVSRVHPQTSRNAAHKRDEAGTGSLSVSVATRKQSYNLEHIRQKYAVPAQTQGKTAAPKTKRAAELRESQDTTKRSQPRQHPLTQSGDKGGFGSYLTQKVAGSKQTENGKAGVSRVRVGSQTVGEAAKTARGVLPKGEVGEKKEEKEGQAGGGQTVRKPQPALPMALNTVVKTIPKLAK